MMKESRGYVIRVEADGTVQVIVGKSDSAGGCTSPSEACDCAEAEDGLVMKVENRAGASVGDHVSVVFKAGAVLKSLLVFIGFPFLGILTGLIAGNTLTGKPGVTPQHAFFLGVACFALSVIVAALVYRGIASQLKPFADRILATGVGAKVPPGVDPVCGRAVKPLGAAARIEYEGRTYRFCGAGCLAAFVKDPQSYAGAPCCARRAEK
jgi:YHS domain-containing protein/positive regulator of sigma E activity